MSYTTPSINQSAHPGTNATDIQPGSQPTQQGLQQQPTISQVSANAVQDPQMIQHAFNPYYIPQNTQQAVQQQAQPQSMQASIYTQSGLPAISFYGSQAAPNASNTQSINAAQSATPNAPINTTISATNTISTEKPPRKPRPIGWTKAEEDQLRSLVKLGHKWPYITSQFPNRSPGAIKKHFYADMKHTIWQEAEDNCLQQTVKEDEDARWKRIGERLGRPAKACERRMREILAARGEKLVSSVSVRGAGKRSRIHSTFRKTMSGGSGAGIGEVDGNGGGVIGSGNGSGGSSNSEDDASVDPPQQQKLPILSLQQPSLGGDGALKLEPTNSASSNGEYLQDHNPTADYMRSGPPSAAGGVTPNHDAYLSGAQGYTYMPHPSQQQQPPPSQQPQQ